MGGAAAAPFLDLAQTRKPNFLIILADDMGFSDAGCYGGDIETPNIEVYDVATGVWNAAGAMTMQRMSHSSVLLPDGTIFSAPPSMMISPGSSWPMERRSAL